MQILLKLRYLIGRWKTKCLAFAYQLYALHKIVEITFGGTVKADTTTRIHFAGLKLPRRLAVKRVQGEVLLVHIHHLLAIVRIQVDEPVLLEADKVQRMLWLSTNDAQAVFCTQQQLQTMGIHRIQFITAQAQRYQNDEGLPVLLLLRFGSFRLRPLRLLPRHMGFWRRFRNAALILNILQVN